MIESREYMILELDCAVCAGKIETDLLKQDFISEANVNYITQKMRLKGNDLGKNHERIIKACTSVEPGVKIKIQDQKSASDNRAHEDAHNHDHGEHALRNLLTGAGLFVLGIFLDKVIQLNIPGFVSFIIYVAAYLLLGGDVILSAVKNIAKGAVFDENFLMTVATFGAFALGDFAEAVAVMLFYKVGEYFEHKAVASSRKAIMSAVDLRPETVVLLDQGKEKVIKAEDANVGDIIVLKPGDRVPLDGRVLSGNSTVDNSAITGESLPVAVSKGSAVISGGINRSGLLQVSIEKPLSESMITRILDSVEKAADNKPVMEKFITKFSRIYTPIVCLAAVLVAVVPPLLGVGSWSEWIYKALSFLVISCPCALVLSVPLAFFSGIGKGSRSGILFKGGAPLEAVTKIKAVIFDKTGTITKGDFAVSKIHPAAGHTEEEVLTLAAIAEKTSNHPIAVSIVNEATARGINIAPALATEEIVGQGVRATVAQGEILCGSRKLLFNNDVSHDAQIDQTSVFVVLNGEFIGYITIEDEIKSDAMRGISELKKAGIKVSMLTGDVEQTARRVGDKVGIEDIRAHLTPEQKLSALQEIRAEHGAVMFVGDGINDAPVISASDVGAAMSSGADIAIESADVVYMNKNVSSVAKSISIAKSARNIAVQNVTFAIAVKFLVMALSILGKTSIWMAVFADTGVALLCVANSLRILYKKHSAS